MTLITLNNDIEHHFLQHESSTDALLVETPIGWKNSNKEIKRSSDTNEFISKNAKNIQFFGKGREYILNIDGVYGSKAKIRYIIVKENPYDSTDFYKDIYFLDLVTLKDKDGVLSIEIDEGGLAKTIKAGESKSIEIERETSLDGATITPLKTAKLYKEGRKIFLNSILEPDIDEVVEARSDHKGLGGKTITRLIPFPLKVISKSHDQIAKPDQPYITDEGEDNDADTSSMFYLVNDRDKTVNVYIDVSFWLQKVSTSEFDNEKIQLIFTIYNNGIDYDIKERTVLIDVPSPNSINLQKFSYKNTFKIDLLKDESIGLEFLTKAKLGSTLKRGRWRWDFIKNEGQVRLTEDSELPGTTTKVVRAHELIDRHLEIITGEKGLLYSNYLGREDLGYESKGLASDMAFASGWWIRQFESVEDKKYTSSLKSDIKSLNAMWCIGTMIEKFGFKERYRVEGLDFFYNFNVTIELPNIVEDFETTYATDFLYGSYEIGYAKGGGDYEEATGIGEYNGKMESSNELETDKTLTLLSDTRGDSSGGEFARRKSKYTHPQEDTRYDNDNFASDTKESASGVLEERKWQDDFEKEPTGIYDPSSATNLRITPARMRNRRNYFITGSLWHYPDSYIRHANSNCNSNLTSQLIGEDELTENGDVQVQSLGRAKFKPYWATFTHKVDYHLSKKLRDTTIINGVEIYNFYGLIKFRVAENEYKHGFLFEVKESGSGKFKVLLANK